MSKKKRKTASVPPSHDPTERQLPPVSTARYEGAAEPAAAAGSVGLSWRRLLIIGIPGVLLFLLMAWQGGGVERQVAIAAAAALIGCSIGKGPLEKISGRIALPVLAVGIYLALNSAAGLYSAFGSFAVKEFAKIFSAFCVFGILLFRLPKGGERPAAAVLSTISALFALVSIDASSLGVLSKGYVGLMDALGCQYAALSIGYESGVRVTGIFGNANILAGILAFGIFLALYLAQAARSRRELLGACLLLECNALGFILSFSMGAMGMFFLSSLLYLLASPRGKRLDLFVLMAETAILSLAMTFLAFHGLGASGAATGLPLLACLLGGVLLWLAHSRLGIPAGAALNLHPKASAGVVLGVAAAAAVYVVLALTVTGSYGLTPGETLRRSVYPDPGTYSLEGDWSGDITVRVESQNAVDTIKHTSTVLYQGSLSGASLTVPEDSEVVYLEVTSSESAQLENLTLSGAVKVPLGYPLLPGFAANRLQGLRANQNAIQRVEFFRDGLRIYAKSPIIGNGLGSVEGLVTSVQRFYYESRYVHNQYIQVLAEMGIPGLLSFVFLLGSTGWTLIRRRMEGEEDLLLPALAACVAMMALHGAVEAVWSIGMYQAMALALIGLVSIRFARPVSRLTGRAAAWIASALLWVYGAVFAVFLYGNLSAEQQYAQIKAGTSKQDAYSMTRLAREDRYNWVQYELDMAVNAADSPVEEFSSTAARYAAHVRKLNIFSVNFSLAQYHYATLKEWDQAFAATREGIAQAASRSSAWQDTFQFYETIFPGAEDPDAVWFAQQSLQLYDMLQKYDQGRLEQITLTQENMNFIKAMQTVAPA